VNGFQANGVPWPLVHRAVGGREVMIKDSANQNVTYLVIHHGARSTIESLLDNEHDSSSRRGGGSFRVAGYIKYSGPGEPARALREKRDAHRTRACHRLG